MLRGMVDRSIVSPLTKGMTSAKWMDIPTRQVPIAELYASQDTISLPALIGPWEPTFSADPYPHAVLYKGRLVLEDGHTRTIRLAMMGRTNIEVRVLESSASW